MNMLYPPGPAPRCRWPARRHPYPTRFKRRRAGAVLAVHRPPSWLLLLFPPPPKQQKIKTATTTSYLVNDRSWSIDFELEDLRRVPKRRNAVMVFKAAVVRLAHFLRWYHLKM